MSTKTYGDEPGGHFAKHMDSQALQTSGVIVAGPAVFYEVVGFNNSGSTRYFHIYDSATVPADAAIPAMTPLAVGAGGTFSYNFSQAGLALASGLSWASSTTVATKTITGAADMWVTITHKALP